MTDYSRGGVIRSNPVTVHVRTLPPCPCGEPLYSIDNGPPEHLIPARTSIDDLRAWTQRCPLLQAEDARARAVVTQASAPTARAYWVPGPIDPVRVTQSDLDRGMDLGDVEGGFRP